jgi:hypothetical protein
MVKYLAQIGLEDVRITGRFDCFRATSKEKTARKYGVHGVNVFARKPLSAGSRETYPKNL